LVPGRYRFRTLETGPETAFDVAEDIAPILEELSWTRDALTADRAATLQAFRDLFSDQVLRPGDEVGVGRVCLLFTDLGGSTALYNDIGDASAYHLVREHFAFLAGIVREHDGAVVKTIGDAVMAAFSDPLDGVAERLAGLTLDQYEMMLRGFAKPIRFHRAVFAE
jgi:class 3 adenylate cyclase